jgi:hypothetical protein
MEAIQLIVQHTGLMPLLNIADIATLRCVSKSVNGMINAYCKDDDEYITHCSLCHLNINMPTTLYKNDVINVKLLLQQCIMIKRLYGNKDLEEKLFETLNTFTRVTVNKLWQVALCGISIVQQTEAMEFVLSCFQNFEYKKNRQQNTIIVYILMCFISRLVAKNNLDDLRNAEKSVLARPYLREIIIAKCKHIVFTLNDGVSSYPYLFINRVIRKCKEVKRKIIEI